MSAPEPRPGILDIDIYVPGDSALPGERIPIKLSSNETPFGPIPAAVDAYVAASQYLHRYPDGSARALREAIGERYGLNADRIVCGAGSDELLTLLAQAYLRPGDEGVFTEHGFLVYRIAILASGGVPVVAKEKNLQTDVDAILDVVNDRTRIVYVANPNNPTGTYIPIKEVRRLRGELPTGVLLVLDGAYAEYVRKNDYEAGLELVANTNNTVMTRTFSKIHGLAALRLGWAYCPEAIADVLNRVRGPFNVSSAAQAAGVASTRDSARLDVSILHNERWLAWLETAFSNLGLKVTSSVANFVLVHFPSKGAHTAAAADTFLKSKAILLRRVSGYGLPNALRMTVGLEAENRAVVAAIAQFLGGNEAEATRVLSPGPEGS